MIFIANRFLRLISKYNNLTLKTESDDRKVERVKNRKMNAYSIY